MVATATSLDDALRASKPIMGGLEGANTPLLRSLKQVAKTVDPAIDAVAVTTAMPDDSMQGAAQKVQKRIGDGIPPAGVNTLIQKMKPMAGSADTIMSANNNFGTLSFSDGDEQQQKQQLAGIIPQGGQEALPAGLEPKPQNGPSGLDKMVGAAESTLMYVGFAPLATDIALPALGGMAGMVGMSGVKNTLNAPKHYMGHTHLTKGLTMRQAINDGVQLGFSAIQTYGVAKGFNENMKALKEMYADVTGQDASNMSTMGMLTAGNLPPIIAEARNHIIKEYGLRGLTQAVGWGLIVRDFIKAKKLPLDDIESGRIGITSGILPGIVNMGIDMLMGKSTTEVYSGFKKAYESGQPIPANEYAAFLLASSPELSRRRVGKQVAMEIGAEYANEKASPGEILRQMNDGRFMARIDKLIQRDEAELTQKETMKAQGREQNGQAKQPSMVERAHGARPDRPKIGKFTGMLSEEGKGLQPQVDLSGI